MKITGILTRFIPIAVLCTIWSLVLTTGTDLLLSLFGVLVIVFLGMVVLMLIDGLRLMVAGLSPRHFLQKYAPAMAHVFSITSSSASLPENMKAAKGMGVPEKIYSLSLPLGVPSKALTGIIGIDAVMDLFIGVVNCFGTMVSTVTVSHREQLLDVARYNEMP